MDRTDWRGGQAVPLSVADVLRQDPQRLSASSIIAVAPISENVSFVCVPRVERAVTTASAPRFMAVTIFRSSAGVAGQAYSSSVKSSNVAPSISSVAVEPLANG